MVCEAVVAVRAEQKNEDASLACLSHNKVRATLGSQLEVFEMCYS